MIRLTRRRYAGMPVAGMLTVLRDQLAYGVGANANPPAALEQLFNSFASELV
jgi:hypothetical protein